MVFLTYVNDCVKFRTIPVFFLLTSAQDTSKARLLVETPRGASSNFFRPHGKNRWHVSSVRMENTVRMEKTLVPLLRPHGKHRPHGQIIEYKNIQINRQIVNINHLFFT